MNYGLPVSVEINGEEYQIRTDFRVILDVLEVLSIPDCGVNEKTLTALDIFYPDFGRMSPRDWEEATRRCYWFIDGGGEPDCEKRPRLMDWEQDFPQIVAPINRVIGTEIRAIPYDRETNTGGLHWWTFLSAYQEIGGDCLFAQIVGIRSKKAKGKKLDKSEQEFYKRNRKLIDFERKYTDRDDEVISKWI